MRRNERARAVPTENVIFLQDSYMSVERVSRGGASVRNCRLRHAWRGVLTVGGLLGVQYSSATPRQLFIVGRAEISFYADTGRCIFVCVCACPNRTDLRRRGHFTSAGLDAVCG